MLGVLLVLGFANGNELHGYGHSSLVEQLEDRMLCIGSDATPGHGCGRSIDSLSVFGDRLAVLLFVVPLTVVMVDEPAPCARVTT